MRLLRVVVAIGWLLIVFPPIAGSLESPDEKRDRLSVASLTLEAGPLAAIGNDYFGPIGETRPAHHEFVGTLDFPPTPMDMSFKFEPWQGWFPTVSVSFFSHHGYLIPLERDIVRDKLAKTSWGIVFSPGRVWSEAADRPWARSLCP